MFLLLLPTYPSSRMFRRRCPRCHKVGLVRGERVIKAGAAVTELFCGACGHAWKEQDPVIPPSRKASIRTRKH
jgi:transcription elongation factor Elf1